MKANYLYTEKTQKIIGIFFKIYNELGFGFLEKVYENALFLELGKAGFFVNKQVPIDVFYLEDRVGTYYSDIIVDNSIIIEIKCAEALCEMHEAQITNYLKATNIEVGLLLNFGPKPSFKRKVFLKEKKS